MRTVRLSLVGTVILSLVGGLGSVVMAQSEPEVATGPEHAWVTLVSEDCDFAGQDSSGEGDGFTWYHGGTYTCDLVFSDPRVSGTLTGVYSDNCFGAAGLPCVFWDSEEITGPEGTWTGGVWGTVQAGEPQATSLKVFTGSGAYEGLTFLLHGVGVLGEQDFYGLIYEGNLPPMPGLAPSE